MTKVIYLASAIDQGTDTHKDWARASLLRVSCAVFDPSAGWRVPRDTSPSPVLQAANLALLEECDGLLALLTPTVLTIGVILEIQHAQLHGIPTAIYAPDLKPSWTLAYLRLETHSNMDHAIDSLTKEMSQ